MAGARATATHGGGGHPEQPTRFSGASGPDPLPCGAAYPRPRPQRAAYPRPERRTLDPAHFGAAYPRPAERRTSTRRLARLPPPARRLRPPAGAPGKPGPGSTLGHPDGRNGQSPGREE
ncbi:hypothetical protein SPBR_04016 [Sporothrix brasiliensis 5110]|uniref:Uncharacterized protein n=1 Tax=Sporothrix brasiliensis 5110 TaxID=1398154 RepID=A0A0C2F838_9PEZI|nr:uncharacterized protein SPBR_04016 [Sporothrix brasiliensis 5110]KIH95189.1 hypothetical protein SPBR_04016 [Sporothrix brasiliensis 5110]